MYALVEIPQTIPGCFEQIMTQKKKQEKASRIPVRFAEEEDQAPSVPEAPPNDNAASLVAVDLALTEADEPEVQIDLDSELKEEREDSVEIEAANLGAEGLGKGEEQEELDASGSSAPADDSHVSIRDSQMASGPMLAELIATRAELRRVETERNDLLERLARRQADFENFRKRVERERGETYQRVVGDVVSKLLPVMDSMRRALEAEGLLEMNESAEFRHFLRGVELIYKQLNDALDDLGVVPVPAVGQPFDPHVHEAVAIEHSDEYEPDTVTQELLRGYRLGEKLLRPAMVKVSTRQ